MALSLITHFLLSLHIDRECREKRHRSNGIRSEQTKSVSFTVTQHQSMAGNDCGTKTWTAIFTAGVVLMFAMMIFLSGGAYYMQIRPKERDYVEGTCRVLAGSYRTRIRKGHTDYPPTWKVQHSGPRFINATIAPSFGYGTRDTAEYVLKTKSVCMCCVDLILAR